MNQYANDFTETVRVYYDDLKKYKPLTKAKERRLLKKCKKFTCVDVWRSFFMRKHNN